MLVVSGWALSFPWDVVLGMERAGPGSSAPPAWCPGAGLCCLFFQG